MKLFMCVSKSREKIPCIMKTFYVKQSAGGLFLYVFKLAHDAEVSIYRHQCLYVLLIVNVLEILVNLFYRFPTVCHWNVKSKLHHN